MIILEYGSAEMQQLELNSMFISFPKGSPTFNEDRLKISGYWNRVYNAQTHEWEVPYNDKTFKDITDMYGMDNIYFRNPDQKPSRPSIEKLNKYFDNFDWGTYKPFPYQLEGIGYGLTKKNWILGDTMGLGKSFQTIQLARVHKKRRGIKHCLVICCVNSLKYNWANEISKFTDESSIILGTRPGKTEKTKNKLYNMTIEETKEQIKSCPKEFFWIINVEKIRATKKEEKAGDTIVDAFNKHIEDGQLGMIIIDEIHMCRNPQAQQSNMLMNLGVKVTREVGRNGKTMETRRNMNVIKVGMSGTLVVNNPLNLYVPMKVVGLVTSNYWVFCKRYVIKDIFGGVSGFQNVGELQDILHASFIRRTKEEVAKDLPPVIFKDEILEMSPEEEKVFNELQDGVKEEITSLATADDNTLIQTKSSGRINDKIDIPTAITAVITRIRQFSTHTGLLSSKIQKSTKFERLRDILEEARMNGEKVLVFCQFTQAIDIAKEYFKDFNPKIIVGGMGSEVMNVVAEHENSEGFSVIFAQTQTLGVGHSLPNTSQVVFLTLLWDYATFEQCFNRCHRITSKRSVTVTNLIMKDTYDEVIYDKIYAKKAMGDVIIDEKEIDAAMQYLSKLGIVFQAGEIKQANTLLLDDISNTIQQ